MTVSVRLAPGDTAPDFTLDDQDGTPVTLSSLRGGKVILYFYPAAKTPGCTTQACDFRDSMASLGSSGYRVLGISKDSVAVLRSFADEQSLAFPLLSDASVETHHAYGAYGEKNLYGKVVTGVIRSTFVLDEAGVLTHTLYNVKATGHVASLRKKLGLSA
ncbi:thioredoxin-dependent thiol peroxidase [Klugiella xanthotipulae]|nr:thioredoxin-dependent thiol peroxidase [Klugiella xanthotipulae]